jgi:hypothetical protein
MKNLALLLFVSCLASVMPAHLAAQTFRLKANIPFAFVMNGKAMPAGPYEINAGTLLQGTLMVRNEDNNVGALAPILAPTDPRPDESSAARLTFDHYGDQYFLARVSPGPEETGLELNTTAEERRAGKHEAANHHAAVDVLATR